MYIFTLNGTSATSKEIKVDAFKDQDFNIQTARRLAKDSYGDYFSSKWMGDNSGFYLTRQSRDIKRVDLCWVGVNADSAKVIIPERSNTYIETKRPFLIKDGKQIIWWSEGIATIRLSSYGASAMKPMSRAIPSYTISHSI